LTIILFRNTFVYKIKPVTAVCAGGLSDRVYDSASSEDVHRIVAAVSCTATADVIPETDCKADDADSLQGKNTNIRTHYSNS